jgi:biofilm PGA synthesis N-glycosyltransferase PgaC
MTVLLIAAGLLLLLYALWLLRMIVCWHTVDATPVESLTSSHLTIVIPFRNEAKHLPRLLHALASQLAEAPGAAILLVDDHSTDESSAIAQDFVNGKMHLNFLQQSETSGKKQGVDLALQHVATEWIVTLDADITPCEGWLKRVASWTAGNTNDLLILPLHIGPGNNLIGKLQEVEFASVMGVTGGMAMIGRPILCNGGNLCFKREAYLRVRLTRSDMHIPSGDDVFLLNALKPGGKVVWIHDPLTRVSTEPQATWMSFAKQRLRWMGKTGFVRDYTLLATAWLTFLSNIAFIGCACAAIMGTLPLFYFLSGAFIKITLDAWLVWLTGKWLCIKKLKRFYAVLVFLYPFYATLFPLLSQFIRPSWKGRKTIIR